MKATLIKETDVYGNMQYYTQLDGQFVSGSLVYINSDLTTEEKKQKVDDAFNRFAQIQYSKGMTEKEIIIENEI
jgi:hypothetical protein